MGSIVAANPAVRAKDASIRLGHHRKRLAREADIDAAGAADLLGPSPYKHATARECNEAGQRDWDDYVASGNRDEFIAALTRAAEDETAAEADAARLFMVAAAAAARDQDPRPATVPCPCKGAELRVTANAWECPACGGRVLDAGQPGGAIPPLCPDALRDLFSRAFREHARRTPSCRGSLAALPGRGAAGDLRLSCGACGFACDPVSFERQLARARAMA